MDNVAKKDNKHWQTNKHWICKLKNYKFAHKKTILEDTFNAYQKFQDRLKINDWNKYLCQPLWCNKNGIKKIRIDKQTVFYKSWFEKELTLAIDLLDENGNFFINRYPSKEISH